MSGVDLGFGFGTLGGFALWLGGIIARVKIKNKVLENVTVCGFWRFVALEVQATEGGLGFI